MQGTHIIPLGEMGGLQYDEGSTKFILKCVDGFGVIIPMIFVMASFWATSILYAPFLGDFDDIHASLLMEM
jgi:hypothetical protein